MRTNLDKTTFNINGETIIGDALKMRQSRLKEKLEKEKLENKIIKPEEEKYLQLITRELNHAREIINKGQKVRQDTDPSNTFQEEKNPTDVQTVGSDSHSKTTSNSKVLPISALKEEIQKIKHLIEYHNNNNK